MTVIAPDTLDWVTFSTEESGPCQVDCPGGCAREAVARAYWDQPCLCSPDTTDLCVMHRDELLEEARVWGPDYECCTCWVSVVLLRIVPIR